MKLEMGQRSAGILFGRQCQDIERFYFIYLFFNIYLFIRLHRVLAAACRIFVVA